MRQLSSKLLAVISVISSVSYANVNSVQVSATDSTAKLLLARARKLDSKLPSLVHLKAENMDNLFGWVPLPGGGGSYNNRVGEILAKLFINKLEGPESPVLTSVVAAMKPFKYALGNGLVCDIHGNVLTWGGLLSAELFKQSKLPDIAKNIPVLAQGKNGKINDGLTFSWKSPSLNSFSIGEIKLSKHPALNSGDGKKWYVEKDKRLLVCIVGGKLNLMNSDGNLVPVDSSGKPTATTSGFKAVKVDNSTFGLEELSWDKVLMSLNMEVKPLMLNANGTLLTTTSTSGKTCGVNATPGARLSSGSGIKVKSGGASKGSLTSSKNGKSESSTQETSKPNSSKSKDDWSVGKKLGVTGGVVIVSAGSIYGVSRTRSRSMSSRGPRGLKTRLAFDTNPGSW